MIKQAIIDTNIVYYLASISENIKFDIEKFNRDLADKKFEIGITYFTLMEILHKYKYDRKNLNKILSFLQEKQAGVIYDKSSTYTFNDVYNKCINSKNKVSYYRNNFIKQSSKYFANFITELSFLFGGVYLKLLSVEKNVDELKYNKAVYSINSFFDRLFDAAEIQIQNIYFEFYHSKLDLNTRKKDRLNKINEHFIEIFKVFHFIFESYCINQDDSIDTFESLKQKIKERTDINLSLVKKMFLKYKKHANSHEEFKKLYFELYGHRVKDTRANVFMFLIGKLILGENFDFNDVVDYYNLISSELIQETENTTFLTTDEKWIDFINKNSDNEYYNNALSFISDYQKN